MYRFQKEDKEERIELTARRDITRNIPWENDALIRKNFKPLENITVYKIDMQRYANRKGEKNGK